MTPTKYFDIIEHKSPCQHIRQYARGTSQSEEDELYLAVKQYVPRAKEPLGQNDGTSITLIACQANGFPKEVYEPLWDALYESLEKGGKIRMRSIWIADYSNQGQSGIWNESKLGNEPSFYDHARDYLAMINHFRKDINQPIVGFGHSMGGNVLLNIALIHPRLFASLTTFEATVFKSPRQFTSLGAFPITFRKDQWPSREDAAKSLRKHPIYKTWDPTVLDLFIKHGLRDLPTTLYPTPVQSDSATPVTLTTTKHQEVLSYTRAAYPADRATPLVEFVPTRSAHPDIGDADFRHPKEPFYRPETVQTFAQLQYLRPSCLWLYGASTAFMPEKHKRAEKTAETGIGLGGSGGVAAGRVKECEVEGGGHFLPFEAPKKLAGEILSPWLEDEMERWEKDVSEERWAWSAVEVGKRNQVSDDWVHWMKTHNDPRKVTRKMRLKL